MELVAFDATMSLSVFAGPNIGPTDQERGEQHLPLFACSRTRRPLSFPQHVALR